MMMLVSASLSFPEDVSSDTHIKAPVQQCQQQGEEQHQPVAPQSAPIVSAPGPAAALAPRMSAGPALYAPNMPASSAFTLSDLLRIGRMGGNPLLQSMQQPRPVCSPHTYLHLCMRHNTFRQLDSHSQQSPNDLRLLLTQLAHLAAKLLPVCTPAGAGTGTDLVDDRGSLQTGPLVCQDLCHHAFLLDLHCQLQVALGTMQYAAQAQLPGSALWMAQEGEVTPRGPPAALGEGSPHGTPLTMPRVGSEAVTSPSDSHDDFCHERTESQVWPSHHSPVQANVFKETLCFALPAILAQRIADTG